MLIIKIFIAAMFLLMVCDLQGQSKLKYACNSEILKETSEHLGKLSKLQMTRFLLTFEDSCKFNVEFSEWSNELLFYTILKQPKLFLSVMSRNAKIKRNNIYAVLESPIHDGINLDSTANVIKSLNLFSVQRDSVLKRLAIAVSKK